MAPGRPQVLVLQRDGDRGQTVVAFTVGDVAYLTSASGADALREVAGYPLTDASIVTDIASVRRYFGDQAPILVETVLLRRKASAKLAGTDDWLFTADALQQATATEVAAHRARRLAAFKVHDVTCSIGTELAALRHTTVEVLGSDVDPVRLAMARHNVAGVALCRADALRPVSRDTVVLADPARRSDGRRRFDPRDYTPPLDALLATYRSREIMVKCSPGIDFGRLAGMGFDGEIEVTSLAGDVREACLWSAGLAEVSRRATVLGAGGSIEQITDAEPDDCAVGGAGRWILDPDGAVVRAGLVRQYAARHGLWQLDPKIAYLSGDSLPPGVRGFEVIESIPFEQRRLRQALSTLDAGVVEILVRGVDVDPARLRPRLRLRGTRQLSVVITRIGAGPAARAVAFICRPSR
ncbi:MAG: class I SAM-dependent methyltransferase [Mycobacteriaceae bacterium]|nr:class I SAM-dependent methyltransferase [Mycobacteriaceae bacterium]